MKSLTGTLFRGVVLGTALVLVGAGSILYLSVRAYVVQETDRSLSDKARQLAQSVEEKGYGLEVDLEEMRVEEMAERDVAEYLHVGTLTGRVIYRSVDLESIPVPAITGNALVENHHWHKQATGGRLRSVLLPYVPQRDFEEEELEPDEGENVVIDTETASGEMVLLELYRDANALDGFLTDFLLMLVGTGFISLGVLSLMVWSVIGRGAQPVRDLATRIADIGDENLGDRIDEGSVFKELVPVVSRLNQLLASLEDTFLREKGFTSDAAHELRTPLAGLRATIEVALGREREGEEYRNTLLKALEIVKQLENLVGSLLSLARLEAGQESGMQEQVSLDSCVLEAWDTYGLPASEKGVSTVFELGDNGATAPVDRKMFVQALEELFNNAVHYVDAKGAIRVSYVDGAPGARICIANTGSRVSREEVGKVFDRFWRGAPAREDTGARFGLGLPIVLTIVRTMGGEVEVKSEKGGEFVVTLTLPEGK